MIAWEEKACALPIKDRTAKAILNHLAFRADEDGVCFPSLARIASDTGANVATVKRKLRWLEDRRYIEISHNHGGGPRLSNTYTLTPDEDHSEPPAAPEKAEAGRAKPKRKPNAIGEWPEFYMAQTVRYQAQPVHLLGAACAPNLYRTDIEPKALFESACARIEIEERGEANQRASLLDATPRPVANDNVAPQTAPTPMQPQRAGRKRPPDARQGDLFSDDAVAAPPPCPTSQPRRSRHARAHG